MLARSLHSEFEHPVDGLESFGDDAPDGNVVGQRTHCQLSLQHVGSGGSNAVVAVEEYSTCAFGTVGVSASRSC